MRVRTLRAGAAQLFADFFKLEAASGILLIAAALIALVCANTPLNDLYQGLRELPVQLQIGAFGIDKPLLLWINDGLMRSEEHTSELQSLMRISYAVFCLKKKNIPNQINTLTPRHR